MLRQPKVINTPKAHFQKVYKRYAPEVLLLTSESYKYSENSLPEGIISKKCKYISQKITSIQEILGKF